MRVVCSSAKGGKGGDRDLPKVMIPGRGQLSWDSNPGTMLDRGGGGGGREESSAGWPGEAEDAFLSLLAVPLAKSPG